MSIDPADQVWQVAGPRAVAILIPTEPVGKARARVTRRGTYTPERSAAYQARVAAVSRSAWRGRPTISRDTPVRLDIWVMHGRPKRLLRKKDPPHRLWCTSSAKPDVDNVVKAVMDGLQVGRVLEEDCCVVRVAVEQMYVAKDEQPHVLVVVRRLVPGAP